MKAIFRKTGLLSVAVVAGVVALQPTSGIATPKAVAVRLVDVSANPVASEAESRTYSRAELRSFVIAAVQIDRVLRQRAGSRPSATSGSETRPVSARIRTIIDATPRLDRARYRAIAEAIRTDPVLRSRVRAVIQDLRNEQNDAVRPLTADTF